MPKKPKLIDKLLGKEDPKEEAVPDTPKPAEDPKVESTPDASASSPTAQFKND